MKIAHFIASACKKRTKKKRGKETKINFKIKTRNDNTIRSYKLEKVYLYNLRPHLFLFAGNTPCIIYDIILITSFVILFFLMLSLTAMQNFLSPLFLFFLFQFDKGYKVESLLQIFSGDVVLLSFQPSTLCQFMHVKFMKLLV